MKSSIYIRQTPFKNFLLVCWILILLDFNVRGESILLSVSSCKKSSLTHTVFHGSDRRYNTISDLTPQGNPLNDVSPLTWNLGHGLYPWKYKVAATVFWVGEQATELNPVSNTESAWDVNWVNRYGGEDDPTNRVNFMPACFTPRQNPFYVALPYNDVDDHHTRPEAVKVIPWFRDSFVRDGQSVCKGRWIAIRHGKRICYAQWEDVGPFQIDHWQYVFGSERPRPNRNHDAGLDVSPAVRDYLGISGIDVCDWKFVNVYEVPDGPWALYGDNNTVAHLKRQTRMAIAKK
jgi:hypothetical protein